MMGRANVDRPPARAISVRMTDAPSHPQTTRRPPFRARWWHAVPFWLLVNLYGFLEKGREPFAGYQPSPLQPPGWVFPVVWFSLTILQLWGCVRLVNTGEGIRHRPALFALQAVLWLLYASFSLVYFTLGSPVLAASWTIAFCVIAVACIGLVWRDDRAIALSWVPLVLWTGFASVVGVQGALMNPDPLFGFTLGMGAGFR